MKFVDALNLPPTPPPPRVPAMPFRIEMRTYGTGPLARVHPTVVRGALVGEVVTDDNELYRAWEYVTWLEQENRALRTAIETVPLLSPTVPPVPRPRTSAGRLPVRGPTHSLRKT